MSNYVTADVTAKDDYTTFTLPV